MRRLVMTSAVAALVALTIAGHAAAWTWPLRGAVLRPFMLGADAYAGGQHRGLDVAGAAGEEVLAPAAGTVTFAGTVPTHGRGVTILTSDGLSVTLTHLGTVRVAKGAVVAEGTVLATAGASGTPEHDVPYVHLGVRVAADEHGYLDPARLLPPRGVAALPASGTPPAPATVQAPAPVVVSAAPPSVPAPAPAPSAPAPSPSAPSAARGPAPAAPSGAVSTALAPAVPEAAADPAVPATSSAPALPEAPRPPAGAANEPGASESPNGAEAGGVLPGPRATVVVSHVDRGRAEPVASAVGGAPRSGEPASAVSRAAGPAVAERRPPHGPEAPPDVAREVGVRAQIHEAPAGVAPAQGRVLGGAPGAGPHAAGGIGHAAVVRPIADSTDAVDAARTRSPAGEGSVAAPAGGALRRVGLFAVVLGIAGLVAAVRRAAATARDTPRGALSRA